MELNPETVNRISNAFIKGLESYIGREKLDEVARLNSEETDARICHSHDFCDANVFMLEAYEAVTGSPWDENDEHFSDEATAYFNAAWDKAKASGFVCDGGDQ